MRTTAILNLKGGVAKTVTCVNMAAILASDYHQRVLVVDADSQANTTEFFGGSQKKSGLSDLLRRKSTMEHPVELQNTSVPNISLLAADESLMDLDLSKVEGGDVDTRCLLDIKPILERKTAYPEVLGYPYDFCLIDCPPAFNAAAAAALLAADDVIIPIKLDAFSLRGMANLTRQIRNMQAINPQLQIAGLLPTMTYQSPQIRKSLQILEESDFTIFPPIRKTNKVDDMTFSQKPLIESSPHSAACVDYRRFVRVYLGGGVNCG
jgi:chromosome partitioning protein